MTPPNNQIDQNEQIAEEAAKAWSVAWTQMIEAGAKAIKSNSYLAKTSADEVSIADTPHEVVFEIDKGADVSLSPARRKKGPTHRPY